MTCMMGQLGPGQPWACSALPQICCVILDKSPSFSGPQLPRIWHMGLVLKPGTVYVF